MLHTDVVGVSPSNSDYQSVQIPGGRPKAYSDGWNWSQPASPAKYGIINPAAAAFRSLWLARIGAAVSALSPDALHLDFNGDYNDGNGLIEGRTFPQGDALFHDQITTAFPNLAIAGELASDINYRHLPAQAGLDMAHVPGLGHPIVRFLFDPQVLTYGHLSTPACIFSCVRRSSSSSNAEPSSRWCTSTRRATST